MVCPWVENGPLTSYLEDRHGSLSAVEILGLVSLLVRLVNGPNASHHSSTMSLLA